MYRIKLFFSRVSVSKSKCVSNWVTDQINDLFLNFVRARAWSKPLFKWTWLFLIIDLIPNMSLWIKLWSLSTRSQIISKYHRLIRLNLNMSGSFDLPTIVGWKLVLRSFLPHVWLKGYLGISSWELGSVCAKLFGIKSWKTGREIQMKASALSGFSFFP